MKYLVAVLLMVAFVPAFADESLRLTLHDHKFSPEKLEVPAGVKFQLIVKNDSDKTIEWESDDLDREEVIEPGKEGTVFLGPLDKGAYGYFDDRHQETKGTLV